MASYRTQWMPKGYYTPLRVGKVRVPEAVVYEDASCLAPRGVQMAGVKVLVVEKEGNAFRIRTGDWVPGWIPAKDVQMLSNQADYDITTFEVKVLETYREFCGVK